MLGQTTASSVRETQRYSRRCHALRRSRSFRRAARISSGRRMRLVLSKSLLATILPSRSIISSCSSSMAACRTDMEALPWEASSSRNFPSYALATTHALNSAKSTSGRPACMVNCDPDNAFSLFLSLVAVSLVAVRVFLLLLFFAAAAVRRGTILPTSTFRGGPVDSDDLVVVVLK